MSNQEENALETQSNGPCCPVVDKCVDKSISSLQPPFHESQFSFGQSLEYSSYGVNYIAQRSLSKIFCFVRIINSTGSFVPDSSSNNNSPKHPIISSVEKNMLLSHTNIVQTFGHFWNSKNQFCILCEYCPYGAVSKLLHNSTYVNTPLTETLIKPILHDILLALSYLHSKNVIHKDIRAASILLDSTMLAKLAQTGDIKQQIVEAQAWSDPIGPIWWMSPEYLFQNSSMTDYEVTTKVDIWSLGITLIELLESQPPFYGEHLIKFIQRASHPSFLPKLEKPEKTSPELFDFISKCVLHSPTDRPTADELLEHPFLQNTNFESCRQNLKSRVSLSQNLPTESNFTTNYSSSISNSSRFIMDSETDFDSDDSTLSLTEIEEIM